MHRRMDATIKVLCRSRTRRSSSVMFRPFPFLRVVCVLRPPAPLRFGRRLLGGSGEELSELLPRSAAAPPPGEAPALLAARCMLMECSNADAPGCPACRCHADSFAVLWIAVAERSLRAEPAHKSGNGKGLPWRANLFQGTLDVSPRLGNYKYPTIASR